MNLNKIKLRKKSKMHFDFYSINHSMVFHSGKSEAISKINLKSESTH